MNKTDFNNKLQSIATNARTEIINLIADVCQQQGGEIKFKYYNFTVIDDYDGETIETDICGAYLSNDSELFFITQNGENVEEATLYSMNELYNICLSINNF